MAGITPIRHRYAGKKWLHQTAQMIRDNTEPEDRLSWYATMAQIRNQLPITFSKTIPREEICK